MAVRKIGEVQVQLVLSAVSYSQQKIIRVFFLYIFRGVYCPGVVGKLPFQQNKKPTWRFGKPVLGPKY